jgi:hypothetical protein
MGGSASICQSLIDFRLDSCCFKIIKAYLICLGGIIRHFRASAESREKQGTVPANIKQRLGREAATVNNKRYHNFFK